MMTFLLRRKGKLLLSTALLLCLSVSARAQNSTLDAIITEALANNQGVKQQKFLLEKSMYALKEARGMFLPEVNFNTTYLDSRGGRKISIPIGDLLNPVYNSLNALTNSAAFPQVENVNQTFNPRHYYDAKFRTSLPLYQAELRYNTDIRREQINLQQAETDLYKRELVRDVKVAYYAYRQAQESARILENAVDLARDNLRFNAVLVKNDKAIRTLVTRSENEVIGLEARLLDARVQATNAAAYLNFLRNLPLDAVIAAEPAGSPALDTQNGTEGRREELTKLESLREIQSLSRQVARAGSLPKLATFIDLGSQGDFLRFNSGTRYYLFGITLDWRVFAGNRTTYRTKQAEYDLKATTEQLGQVGQQLELQTATATNNLYSARKLYDAARSQTALSQQYYQDQQKLYRGGQLLYIELLDAQNQLISDQLQESIAFLNVQTRSAELERATASYVMHH